jgi:hypothetical protein
MPPSRLVPFRRGSLWGYADQRRHLVLPLRYDDAGPFIGDIAWVRHGANFGYISPDGSPLTPLHFTRADNFQRGHATVELSGETFQINQAGTRLTALPDSAAETDFMEQGDLVRRNGKVGFRFSVGHADEIRDSYNGLLFVRRGTKWGVINQKGQLTLPLEYDAIRATPANGYAFPIIEQAGRLGYLDAAGKLLVKPQYREAQPFVAGTARVLTEGGQAGYIDVKGREFFEE